MSNLTDQEIRNIVANNSKAEAENADHEAPVNGVVPNTTRKLLIVGCGDGGCNIASTISEAVPDETFVITYNTSNRGVRGVAANMQLLAAGEDGAGKVRAYSKEVFKNNIYAKLLEKVQMTLNEIKDIAYIILCSTADGGTGSGISPMAAKLLADNTEVPVIVMGVYPEMTEDATAQFNAMQWQSEINQIGLPYFILDNNAAADGVRKKRDIHDTVNAQAASIISLLAGREFNNSNISIIDNRNLYMLLAQLGGRLVAGVSTSKPSSNQTLDDLILNILENNYQPAPANIRGIGVFIRGPKEFIDRMDTSIPEMQKKYGTAILKFAHIEVADEVKTAILCTGCSEASARITLMKNRYEDIMASQREQANLASDLLSGLTNPLGAVGQKKTRPAEANVSALDL